MPLLSIKSRLVREVLSVSHAGAFKDGQNRHAALAAHDHIASVLGVLGRVGPHHQAEKEELVRALVAEYQATRHPLWSGALTVAFLPMLHTLRARIVGDAVANDDLDQVVLTAFIDAAARVDLEAVVSQTSAALRSRTWKLTMRHVQGAQRARELFVPTALEALFLDRSDDEEGGRLEMPSVAAWPEAGERRRSRFEPVDADLIDLLIETVGDAIPRDDLDMLIATYLSGQRLSALVTALHPRASKATQAREYERLKRARSRVIRAISPHILNLICPRSRG